MGSLPIVIISGAFFFQPNQHQACETHLQNFKVLMPGFVRQMLSTDSISDIQILSTELSLESPPQLPTSYSFPPCACPEVTIHLHCRFRSSCTHSHLSPPTQKQEAEAGAKKPKQAEECTQRIFKGAVLPHCSGPFSYSHHICLCCTAAHHQPPTPLSPAPELQHTLHLFLLAFVDHLDVRTLSAWLRSYPLAFSPQVLKQNKSPNTHI